MQPQESGCIFQDQHIKKLRAFFIINFWCLMVSCGSFRKFLLSKNLDTMPNNSWCGAWWPAWLNRWKINWKIQKIMSSTLYKHLQTKNDIIIHQSNHSEHPMEGSGEKKIIIEKQLTWHGHHHNITSQLQKIQNSWKLEKLLRKYP